MGSETNSGQFSQDGVSDGLSATPEHPPLDDEREPGTADASTVIERGRESSPAACGTNSPKEMFISVSGIPGSRFLD